jgi:nucleoside-diphosphate-sugar epimerase
MSNKPIVLVTGANGYIAGPTIEGFLKAGYAVRGTVRSKSSADSLVKALSSYSDDLEIVQVPDILAPGAFDSAVRGKLTST